MPNTSKREIEILFKPLMMILFLTLLCGNVGYLAPLYSTFSEAEELETSVEGQTTPLKLIVDKVIGTTRDNLAEGVS